MSFERTDDDVYEFHNASIVNQLFSVLHNKVIICQNNKNHSRSVVITNLLLDLSDLTNKDTLKSLIAKYFMDKISAD